MIGCLLQVGLHVIGALGGVLVAEYARVERCGQRHRTGRYCLHLHLLGACPHCVLRGNAIEDSQQGGITVHGTHESRIEDNVLWDTRANGIYVEDGNEMHNMIRRNVVVRPPLTAPFTGAATTAAFALLLALLLSGVLDGAAVHGRLRHHLRHLRVRH